MGQSREALDEVRTRQAILIVDDRPQNLLALRRTLAETGADVVEATSGEKALAATLRRDFALAVLDVHMPDMDGYELAGLLRGDPKTRNLPIIFLTAAAQDEQQVFKGYESGAVDYIVKPYNPTTLVSKVRVFLELHAQRVELEKHREHLEQLVEERTREVIGAEKRLARARDYADRIVDGMTEGLLVVSRQGIIERVNSATLKMLGYRAEELVGEPIEILVPDHVRGKHPALRDRYLSEPRSLILGGGRNLRARHKDGHEVPVEIGLSPFDTGNGLAILTTLVDVSERKRLEEQLRAAQRLEAVGRLAGGVAHDFNNVLTVIRSFTEFLLERFPEGDPARDDVGMISDAADRAARLTAQLLAFSRRQPQELRVLNLNGMLDELDGMLRRLIGEDIDIVTKLEPDLDAVKADLSQLEQIFMNLAANARDAMPKGGKLTFETTNVELDRVYGAAKGVSVPPGRYVMLAVTDSGVGIDDDTLQHIFEPFFTTKDKERGSGLGLATVYGIVKQNRGYIWVYSEVGKGTTFKIYLPRADGEPSQRQLRGRPTHVGGNETILLAEDEEMIRRATVRILERAGYRVLEATNGPDALSLAERHEGPIDLLLTDVVMPNMSGKDLADRLASAYPRMHAVFMSGYTDDAIVHHGVLQEGVAYVQKPFSPGVLLSKVREVLDG